VSKRLLVRCLAIGAAAVSLGALLVAAPADGQVSGPSIDAHRASAGEPDPSTLVPASIAPVVVPERIDGGVDLDDGALREAVTDLDRGLTTDAPVVVDGDRIRVEILHHGTDAQLRRLVGELGGRVDGVVPGTLAEAEVPSGSLEALEASPLVDVVQPPAAVVRPDGSAAVPTGDGSGNEAVSTTNADDWQAAGRTGAGVRIGIIDWFDAAAWDAAEAAGEVPTPGGTFCRSAGADCDVFAGGTAEGVAIAEVIHDMAPDATLYLASVGSTADLQAAVDWFDGQGVDLINRSTLSPFDDSGRGQGPTEAVMRSALTDGMAWFQAVGDNAGRQDVRLGSYLRWTFADADSNGFVEFAPGDEVLEFWCGDQLGLRWSDFGENGKSDYDMLVFDPADFGPESQPIATSIRNQTGSALPIERTTACVPGWNYLVVARYTAGASSAGDVFEFAMDDTALGRWSNPFSAGVPGTGSVNDAIFGDFAVGAVDPALSRTVADYSGRGPINGGGGVAPSLVAPSCLAISVVEEGCFDGTAASTAVATGAAALIWGAGLVRSPTGLRNWLDRNALVDRGPRHEDNGYGRGEIVLRVIQPDVSVRKDPRGAWSGDGVYSPTGANEGARAEIRPGATQRFTIRVQNDGLVPDRFRIQGDGSATRYTVTYAYQGRNRTAAIVNGSIVTPVLQPGRSVLLGVAVRPKPGATYQHMQGRFVRATSTTATHMKDAVWIHVRALA
jgi:hypothetical protein